MKQMTNRARLLGGAALGLGLTIIAASPAQADSACLIGVIDVDTVGADCTSVNGNGHSEANHTGVFVLATPGPSSLLAYSGDLTSALTTGYIETTTAGRGVLDFTTTQAFTYVGTGSTLFGDAAATGATMLNITGPSVTLNSGNIIAAGAGSTALAVTANGGAGSGGINVTVDGIIQSFRPIMGGMLVVAALWPLIRSLFYAAIPVFKVTPS